MTIADLVSKPKVLTIADKVATLKAKMAPAQDISVKKNMVRSIYTSPFAPSFKESNIMDALKREDDS